ncbi:MAG: putative phage abortive infection protein [Bacteroidia bacterium]
MKKLLNKYSIHILIVLLACFFFWGLHFIFKNIYNIQGITPSHGNLGSYLSGTAGVLFSILTISFLLISIFQNKQVIEMQREELEDTRKEFIQQNETLKNQRFENTFFHLLNLHNEIVDKLYITREKITGHEGEEKKNNTNLVTYEKREFFDGAMLVLEYGNNLKDEFSDIKENIASIRDAYTDFNYTYGSYLSHYFRNLYHIYKYIYLSTLIKEKEKSFYASIVRAQLSDKELTLIFYNMFIDGLGYPNFKFLDQEYDVLKNLIFDQEGIPDGHIEAFNSLEVGKNPFENEY